MPPYYPIIFSIFIRIPFTFCSRQLDMYNEGYCQSPVSQKATQTAPFLHCFCTVFPEIVQKQQSSRSFSSFQYLFIFAKTL